MKIEIPKNCPCCGYTLQLVNDQLFCRNTACDAQLFKKIEHFAKTLSIKGLGPKTVEKLDLGDITELFHLELEQVIEAIGSEKQAIKLLDEIERAKVATLATVLASFSIPLVGNTAATKIANVVSNISEITQETCKRAGLGDKVTANLLSWLATDFVEMREFLPFSFTSEKTITATGDTVCITGKLTSYKTKAEATKQLEQAGFVVVETVTKTLKYLVDEQNNNSTKRAKADQYGVTIIPNVQQFLKDYS
jgi:NAD-dependent DNA ligase